MKKILLYIAIFILGVLSWNVYFFVRTNNSALPQLPLQNDTCIALVPTSSSTMAQEYRDKNHDITFLYPFSYTLCAPQEFVCPDTISKQTCEGLLRQNERDSGINFRFELKKLED
jgi:hypothetical protein